MPSYVPAKRATAYVTYVSLIDSASGKLFVTNPTLAAGDVKLSIDGGALANPATLPVVTPAGSKLVKVSLSAAEMTGDTIAILFSDVAGAEWNDLLEVIDTSVRQIDDLAFPTVSGRSLDVTATGAAGVDWANVESQGTAVTLSATTISPSQVVASVTGAVGSVTGSVGSVTGSVGSVAANGITAASIATGAIDADAMAADVTTELQAGLATASALATVQTSINDLPTNAELATALATADDAVLAAIAALNNLSAAAVNAEVVDALSVDTYAEQAQQAPPATATLAVKMGYLYMAWRNKVTQTSTTYSLFNDAGSVVNAKATVSADAVTFQRDEIVSGP